MARKMYAGNAPATTLNGAINSTTSTIVVTSGTGYPSGASGNFYIVIDRGLSAEEKILCSATSGATITAVDRTVSGNRDGTTNASHVSGATVEHVFTAQDADEANSHVNDNTTNVHTQYLLKDGTVAPTGVGTICGIPGSSAVGDAAAKGAGLTLATSNHVHGREAFATPVATGVANAAGAATTVPRSDHVHLGNATLGQATVTANQTGISTGPFTDLTSLTTTVTVVAGRRIKITASFLAQNNGAPAYLTAAIREGSTTLKTFPLLATNSNQDYGFYWAYAFSPTTGSHTYKLSLSGGTGSTQMSASATDPAFILVEDIGV